LTLSPIFCCSFCMDNFTMNGFRATYENPSNGVDAKVACCTRQEDCHGICSGLFIPTDCQGKRTQALGWHCLCIIW
jgi:hypothetical protein